MPGAETAKVHETYVAVVVGAAPACFTVTVGAVPRPAVTSMPVIVIVTTWPTPPGRPAGSGVAVTTVKTGLVRSRMTLVVTAPWLTLGAARPAQHQLPKLSLYSAASVYVPSP